jgi:hypothetical protein
MTDVGAVSSAEPQDPLVQSHKIVIDLAIIALIGLAVQGFWVWQVTEPTYMDSYYYATNGQPIVQIAFPCQAILTGCRSHP